MKTGDIELYLAIPLITCGLVRWYYSYHHQRTRRPTTILRDDTIKCDIPPSQECHERVLDAISHNHRVPPRTDIMKILGILGLSLFGLYSCVAAFNDDHHANHLRRQNSGTNTTNTSSVLVDFEVYKPVEFEPASQECNEVVLLMEYEFANSYGEPFVGKFSVLLMSFLRRLMQMYYS